MRRPPRTLLLLVVAGCASPTVAPLVDGGSGSSSSGLIGTGGFGTTTGGGGFGLGGAGGSPSSVDASACAAFVETFTPACNQCLDMACCDVASMCIADANCFGYVSCQQNCPPAGVDGGNACLDACTQSFPTAGTAFSALTACLHATCPACPY
jgi:hypothetical protein